MEVFLSALLSPSETAKSKEIILELCSDAIFLSRISKTVALRVVSSQEIILLAHLSCVTVTPLALMQLRRLRLCPAALAKGRYRNFFLHGKTVAFLHVLDSDKRRLTVMAQSMGGAVKSALDPGLDVILTGADREIEDRNTFYDRALPLIRVEWLYTLWAAHDFVDPITFAVRGPPLAAAKPRRLQTPISALRQIPGNNRAEVLRKRDATVPITQFLPPVERKLPPQEIQAILAEMEGGQSGAGEMEALCREIRGSRREGEKRAGSSGISVTELETFTQAAAGADEREDATVVGYDAPHYRAVEPRTINSDPLLWLLSDENPLLLR
jgi:hypothetical protein